MPYSIRGTENEGMVSGMAQFIGEDDDDLLDSLAAGLSDPELVGEDDDDEIDMIGRRLRKSKAAKNMMARAIAARSAGMIVERPITKRRRQPSGFTRVAVVAAGATVGVLSSPQNLVRLERLIVPSDNAFFYSILDIKIGNISQLVQAQELPAAMFSEVAIDSNVWFDTAQVGNQVSLSVRNDDAIAHPFQAGMIGSVGKS